MGTYYMAVNHTRCQKINPHELDEGAKLGEARGAKDLLWRLLALGIWDARRDDIEIIADARDEDWVRCDSSYAQMTPADVE